MTDKRTDDLSQASPSTPKSLDNTPSPSKGLKKLRKELDELDNTAVDKNGWKVLRTILRRLDQGGYLGFGGVDQAEREVEAHINTILKSIVDELEELAFVVTNQEIPNGEKFKGIPLDTAIQIVKERQS